MDVNPYIESGIIEEYCLGILSQSKSDEVVRLASEYPEIQLEIHRLEATLVQYARKPIRTAVKSRVMDTLSKLSREEAIDLSNPPMLHRHSDYTLWNASLENMEPDSMAGTTKTKVFFRNQQFQLCVIWLPDELVEAGHDDDKYHESVLILEGRCACNLNGRIVRLEAGDFLDIPANTPHSIKNVSEGSKSVKALIQRVRKTA